VAGRPVVHRLVINTWVNRWTTEGFLGITDPHLWTVEKILD